MNYIQLSHKHLHQQKRNTSNNHSHQKDPNVLETLLQYGRYTLKQAKKKSS